MYNPVLNVSLYINFARKIFITSLLKPLHYLLHIWACCRRIQHIEYGPSFGFYKIVFVYNGSWLITSIVRQRWVCPPFIGVDFWIWTSYTIDHFYQCWRIPKFYNLKILFCRCIACINNTHSQQGFDGAAHRCDFRLEFNFVMLTWTMTPSPLG